MKKPIQIMVEHANGDVDVIRVNRRMVGWVADALCQVMPSWTIVRVAIGDDVYELEDRPDCNPLWRSVNGDHTRHSALERGAR